MGGGGQPSLRRPLVNRPGRAWLKVAAAAAIPFLVPPFCFLVLGGNFQRRKLCLLSLTLCPLPPPLLVELITQSIRGSISLGTIKGTPC